MAEAPASVYTISQLHTDFVFFLYIESRTNQFCNVFQLRLLIYLALP